MRSPGTAALPYQPSCHAAADNSRDPVMATQQCQDSFRVYGRLVGHEPLYGAQPKKEYSKHNIRAVHAIVPAIFLFKGRKRTKGGPVRFRARS